MRAAFDGGDDCSIAFLRMCRGERAGNGINATARGGKLGNDKL